MKSAARFPPFLSSLLSPFFFALFLLLTLTACDAVNETLIINETGTGSLLIDWTVSEQQLVEANQTSESLGPIDRARLSTKIDEAFGTSGYVLSDRVAFNELRGERTGFTITKPIRNLDDVRALGADDLQSGRPPVLLWRDINLDEATDGSLTLSATPSVEDRQNFMDWVAVQDEMVFVASFSPRGQITSHNADEIDGNTLRWRLAGAEERNLEVAWVPMAPDSQSALPFVIGLLVIVALCAVGLYAFDKRNLDRHAH